MSRLWAVREGRIAFQRLLAYTSNLLVKKFEIVLFLALGLGLTGHAVLTPSLMVLLFVTNDSLAMSLTTDRASASPSPRFWRMRNITAAAVVLALCKLGFSTAVLAYGRFRLGLGPAALETLAFATLVFGNQAVLFVLRERRHLWSSRPGAWVLAPTAADVAFVALLALLALLALPGVLMAALPWRVLAAVFVAAALFALLLDQVRLRVRSVFKLQKEDSADARNRALS